jgi:fructoselysine-6-P-deglycase FrlB-like protein
LTGEGSPSDRATLFEADIDASADALARLLDQAPRPALAPTDGRSGRLALVGLGSSRFAALIVASHLRAAGRDAWAEYASSDPGTAPAHDLTLVAISASGRTREVVETANRHRGMSRVVAVTNDPGSPLAAHADLVVPLHAGTEASGIACRTFRATVAALAMLAGVPADDLRSAVAALSTRIESRTDWIGPLADGLDGAPSIDVLADASLLGIAEQGALMLREAPRLPARAYDTGDWLHVGVYLALPGHRALMYPGARTDHEVIATVERRGGTVLRVEPAIGGPIARALADSVAAELVAAELWRRAVALPVDRS